MVQNLLMDTQDGAQPQTPVQQASTQLLAAQPDLTASALRNKHAGETRPGTACRAATPQRASLTATQPTSPAACTQPASPSCQILPAAPAQASTQDGDTASDALGWAAPAKPTLPQIPHVQHSTTDAIAGDHRRPATPVTRLVQSARPLSPNEPLVDPSVWSRQAGVRPPSRQKPPPEALHLFASNAEATWGSEQV